MTPVRYHNRDISWLSFNQRILMEGKNKNLPIFDRIKFLAIYSSNLDEFYRVRVAALQSLAEIESTNQKTNIEDEIEGDPNHLISIINEKVFQQQVEFGKTFHEEIYPELDSYGIHLLHDQFELPQKLKSYCLKYFRSRVLSYLQPVFIRKKKNAFLINRALYLIVELRSHKDSSTELAYVNIPSGFLPRVIKLPRIDDSYYFIFLDDLVRLNLDKIFIGYEVVCAYSVKLNRNADLQIDDEFSGDLVQKIRSHLHIRGEGAPARFLFDREMPEDILKTVTKKFQLKGSEMVRGGRYHSLFDLMNFKNPKSPELESKPWPSINHGFLEAEKSILEAVKKRDILLHFPYHSYDYVLMFFNEAAIDPRVKEIQATFYRVASDSFITNALISAAKNGKKVKAFIELKARFDEENNLKWAEKMENAGVKITYSIPGLKVHAKTALIKREDEDGNTRSYAFFGTGNFNEKTAKIYSDIGLLTSNTDLTNELESVFGYLYKRRPVEKLDHLLVSQFNIIDKFNALIDREIQNANEGKPARITIKINNIDDPAMIEKLYEASRAGVEIKFIIRGICRLIPSKKDLSENITARRIVGRYLEHSRIFIFHNNNNPEYYLGSADWMKRNLYRRIEVIFPVFEESLKNEIQTFIDLQWNDNTTAVTLSSDLKNLSPERTNSEKTIESQKDFYYWVKEKEEFVALS